MTKITDQLPQRINCTHPGCTECAAQVKDGKLLFRARHNGEKHQIALDVAAILALLEGAEASAKITPQTVVQCS